MLAKDQTYEDKFEDNVENKNNPIYPNASIGVVNSRSIITLDRLSSYAASFDSLMKNNERKSEVSL